MIARENGYIFGVAFLVGFVVVLYEVLEQIEQTVGLPDVLPQVCSSIFAFDGWIVCETVERKEIRIFTGKARCHKCIVVVNGEMHQTRFQKAILRIAVFLILIYGICIVPMRCRKFVLQFAGHYWQTVDKEHQIESVVAVLFVGAVFELLYDCNMVLTVKPYEFVVVAGDKLGLILHEL